MLQRAEKGFRSAVRRVVLGVGLSLIGSVGLAATRPIVLLQSLDGPGRIAVAQATQRGPVTLQEAVAMATRRFDGRVVRAETKTLNGVRVHEIRLLDDSGRVRTVRIDAQTGQFR